MNTPFRSEFQFVSTLSAREYEAFLLFGDGLTTGEVAKKVFRSIKTIESHVAEIRKKARLPHICAVRNAAAKFVAFHGKPEMQAERITLHRLVPVTEKTKAVSPILARGVAENESRAGKTVRKNLRQRR